MKQVLLFLLMLIPFQMAFAQEILLSTEQSEYYFKIGEDAIIPVQVDNSYGNQISGTLQYTIAQQINQGNFQFSNSKTNANTFVIEEGNRSVSLNFGTSNSPTTFVMNFNFIYNDGTDKTVSLGPITVNFVEDNSQKNNKSNPMQSTTGNTPSQQDPLSQQRQQMQQRLDQLLGNKQTLPQDPQQRLQNNQLSQDSSALKKQIQEQLQQQEETQKEFEKQLSSNSNFAAQHNQLLQNGYNVTGGNIEPISNNTGSFEIQYKNEEGKWATLHGQMNNGTITEIKQQTQEQQENLLEKLEQNPQYQKFKEQLIQSGFSQDNVKFEQDENKTSVIVEYNDEDQDYASITGIFEENDLLSVSLKKNSSDTFDLSVLIAIAITIVGVILTAFFILKKLSKKKPSSINKIPEIQIAEPFDYVSESRKMIDMAQQHYNNKEFKDAFGIAGQGIRLLLSYQIDQKKEITNEELVQLLPKDKYPIDEIRECLNKAEMIEFAKDIHLEDDFKKIVSLFEKLE